MTLPDLDSFRACLQPGDRVVLCTHRHPDPDGLGALVALQHLLREAFEVESDLVLEGRIRRAENIAMRELLEITALPKGGVDPSRYTGIFVVDAQPGFTHTNPPGALNVLGVIDHHELADEKSECKAPSFCWVDPNYGATSTMLYDLLRAFDVELDIRAATALFCGVRYDTNDLARDATPQDAEAYFQLQKMADRRLVAHIDQPELSRGYFREMADAIESCQCYGPLLLTLMGEVPSPEMVAEVADWFVRLRGKQWSLAGGACDNRYQVSVRTDMPGADAYPALRYIVGAEGSCGGHGRMAGGQIPLTGLSVEEVQALVRRRALEVFGEVDTEGEPLARRENRPQAS
ncbi:MAG TPA: DHH family phosphoesterase [Planctomycetota bacterium]|jgi:nanoRNase/pAp phosphatase (c-di-AMP/oligoRNAs hydrolase)|nr:DHH family phosphoesterase [Planctomycetota bacterium]HJM40474.1 DHH family phosphoesterase [Planctomycetota bacterium]|tara:strand:- start:52147 stop:53187 length:1041 start_codon:yes stop_codon:yes gene_type:complete